MPAETEWQRRTRREHERARYIEAHGNFCELCGNEPKSRGLSEDHDHKTGAHRGWLCYRCNRALPVYVTLGWLLRAALYLTPPYLEWLRKDLKDLIEQVAAITPGVSARCIGFGEREGRCLNDAGSSHSQLWCQECDDARRKYITAQMDKVSASFGARGGVSPSGKEQP